MGVKISLFILMLVVTTKLTEQKRSLKQVLVLSRHSVRTPLAKNLDEYSPKPWPKWKEKSGDLTEKGILVEGFMGKFFYAWLNGQGLLPDRCPNKEELFVYANAKQRTIASAKAFVDKAYPGCNITVHHKEDPDPIFDPVIHNSSTIFKEMATQEMEDSLNSLSLNSSYEEIDCILDYKNSNFCKTEKQCDLTTDRNKIKSIVVGEKPNLTGPLKIGNWAIDSFLMQYYEGLPLEKVAWGKLSTKMEWETIMMLSRGYHNVILNTTLIAKDISDPLIKYMTHIFLNNDVKTKVTLLMGHDANLYTVLNNMKFKNYILPNQYEITPIGGKIVFQKWFDDEIEKDFLKINYVYQSSLQLRNGEELSFEKPPQFVNLELMECNVDDEGFCLWSDFVKFLNSL